MTIYYYLIWYHRGTIRYVLVLKVNIMERNHPIYHQTSNVATGKKSSPL